MLRYLMLMFTLLSISIVPIVFAGYGNEEISKKSRFYWLPSQTYIHAIQWCHKAAEQGDVEAQAIMREVFENDPKPFWIPESKKSDSLIALKWCRKAAEQGDVEAQAIMGTLYCENKDIEWNDNEAKKWRPKAVEYFKAMEHGSPEAQFDLGVMYFEGKGCVVKDHKEALRLFRKAAEQGYSYAQFELGRMYSEGKGFILQDCAEALRLFHKAAEQGEYNQCRLGQMYLEGEGCVPRDYAEALKLFHKVAEQGDLYVEFAQLRLGQMYSEGKGVAPDFIQGHMWFNLASVHFSLSSSISGSGNKAQEMRDSLAKRMTPPQIAEAQRLAREWKPKKRDEIPIQNSTGGSNNQN